MTTPSWTTPSWKTFARVALIAAPLVVACDAAPDDEGAFLFELREAEIRDAAARYVPDADADMIVEQMRTPFDCEQFGAACDTLGEEGAYNALETVWMAALDEVDVETLLDAASPEPSTSWAAAASSPTAAPSGLPALPTPIVPTAPTSATDSGFDACIIPPFTTETLSVDATVSDFGLLVVGSASFDATRSVWDLFPFTGPLVDDFTLRGQLTTSGGTSLGSRIRLATSSSSGNLSIVALSVASGFEMWALVTGAGAWCGGLSAEATASL